MNITLDQYIDPVIGIYIRLRRTSRRHVYEIYVEVDEAVPYFYLDGSLTLKRTDMHEELLRSYDLASL